jgi:tetratricopeptide (TPR) repeat protein
VEILERSIEYYQVTYEQGVNAQALFIGMRTILYLGITSEYRDRPLWKIIPEWLSTPVFRYIPLYWAHQEHTGEVNERLDWMLERRPNITSRDDLTHTWLDIAYLESAVLVGNHKVAELLLERFKDNTLATTGLYWPTCIARHMGAAAALLERYDEARGHYKEALRVCTKMKFRPELALSRLQLAELLLDHYPDEKKEALEHLDFAIKEFREMKMQPYLERALRRKDILKA